MRTIVGFGAASLYASIITAGWVLLLLIPISAKEKTLVWKWPVRLLILAAFTTFFFGVATF